MSDAPDNMNTITFDFLIRQAIAHANQTWNPDSGPEGFVFIAMKKHAELIIQECMNVLHDNELWNRHISHALHEHFGIE